MSAGKFTIKVKDGDYGYILDGGYGVKDFVFETEDPVAAFRTFLEYIELVDDDEDVKAVLKFRHKAHDSE